MPRTSRGQPHNHPIIRMQREATASLRREEIAPDRISQFSKPKVEALLARQVLLKRQQDVLRIAVGEICPDLSSFSVISNHTQKCLLFYTDDKSCWILVHFQYKERCARRSIVYASKDLALTMWNCGHVKWVEHKMFPTRQVSSPPD